MAAQARLREKRTERMLTMFRCMSSLSEESIGGEGSVDLLRGWSFGRDELLDLPLQLFHVDGASPDHANHPLFIDD